MGDTFKEILAGFPDTLTMAAAVILYEHSEMAQKLALAGEQAADWFTKYGSGVACVAAFTAFSCFMDKMMSRGEGTALGRMISYAPALGVIAWEIGTLGRSGAAPNNPVVGDPIDMLYAGLTGAALIGLSYVTRNKEANKDGPYVLEQLGKEIKDAIVSKFSRQRSPQYHCLEDRCVDNPSRQD